MRTPDFKYDAYGNLVEDRDKEIKEIVYNHMNLPVKILIGSDGKIEYIYDAAGTKLKKIVTEGSAEKITEYVDGFIYFEGNLDFFPTAEGYVQVSEDRDTYEYQCVFQYKDHTSAPLSTGLGNIRLSYADLNDDGSIDSLTEILEEKNYYPFGLEHKGYNNVVNGIEYNYKQFQGQEINKELGLNWLSFKYRNYDPAIGRFFNIDPLTEKYNTWSPYAFSGNRVIDARELEGLEPHSVHKTLDDAATNFGQHYNGRSIINKKEYASRFYSTTNEDGSTTYSYVEPLIGNGSMTFIPNVSSLPKGTDNAGDIHTHGNDEAESIEGETDADNVPSYQDIESTKEGDLPSYVVIPAGKVLKIDPKTGEVTTVSTDVPSDPASGSKRTNSIDPSLQPYTPSRSQVEPVNSLPSMDNVDGNKFDIPNIDQLIDIGGNKF